MKTIQSRRRFLTNLSLASAAALVGAPKSLHAEPPPETTTVRLANTTWASCVAAPYVAQELLRAEGITDFRYVVPDWDKKFEKDTSEWIARGEIDFDWNFAPVSIRSIDAGVPIKLLAGLHSGCLELMAHEGVQKITDLKGKRVGVDNLAFDLPRIPGPHDRLCRARSQQRYPVGHQPRERHGSRLDGALHPRKDRCLPWHSATAADAPCPEDRPLDSQHEQSTTPGPTITAALLPPARTISVRYPVATKRVLRAILKAADLCVSHPKWVARQLVDRGFDKNYDLILQTLADVRYDRWRDFDIEDTVRFYALRMQEVGMINTSPNKIIADGSDWRFINELKRELKS